MATRLRIECGLSLGSGSEAALQSGTIEDDCLPFVDQRLARVSARTAPGPLTREALDAWRAVLGAVLEPLAARHHLAPILRSAAEPPALAVAVFRTADVGSRAWDLEGSRSGPALLADDAWDGFRKALGDERFFLAHDLLESSWRETHASRAQAAIWVAAAFYHRSRQNVVGAGKLLAKARARAARDPGADGRLMTMLEGWVRAPERADPLSVEASGGWDLLVRWGRGQESERS